VDAPGTIRLGTVELDNQGIFVRPGSRGFDFAGIKLDALLAHGFLKHCVHFPQKYPKSREVCGLTIRQTCRGQCNRHEFE